MQTREELEKAILALPKDDQYYLADRLEAHFLADPELAAAWTNEIDRRLKEYDEGKVKASSFDDMFAYLEKKYFSH